MNWGKPIDMEKFCLIDAITFALGGGMCYQLYLIYHLVWPLCASLMLTGASITYMGNFIAFRVVRRLRK